MGAGPVFAINVVFYSDSSCKEEFRGESTLALPSDCFWNYYKYMYDDTGDKIQECSYSGCSGSCQSYDVAFGQCLALEDTYVVITSPTFETQLTSASLACGITAVVLVVVAMIRKACKECSREKLKEESEKWALRGYDHLWIMDEKQSEADVVETKRVLCGCDHLTNEQKVDIAAAVVELLVQVVYTSVLYTHVSELASQRCNQDRKGVGIGVGTLDSALVSWATMGTIFNIFRLVHIVMLQSMPISAWVAELVNRAIAGAVTISIAWIANRLEAENGVYVSSSPACSPQGNANYPCCGLVGVDDKSTFISVVVPMTYISTMGPICLWVASWGAPGACMLLCVVLSSVCSESSPEQKRIHDAAIKLVMEFMTKCAVATWPIYCAIQVAVLPFLIGVGLVSTSWATFWEATTHVTQLARGLSLVYLFLPLVRRAVINIIFRSDDWLAHLKACNICEYWRNNVEDEVQDEVYDVM